MRLIKLVFLVIGIFVVLSSFVLAEETAHIVLSNEQNFVFMENDGTGKFSAKQTIDVGPEAHEISAGDFDLDGIMDAAVNHHTQGAFTVLWGNPDKTFNEQRFDIPIAPDGEMHAISSGDFDEDGDIDLALVDNGFQRGVVIAYSNGKREFSEFKKFEISRNMGNIRVIKVSDFNNDRHLDFIVPNSGANNAFIFFGDGTGNFNVRSFEAGLNLHNIEIGDVDNDGDVDVALTDSKYIKVLKNEGKGEFSDAPTTEAEGLFCVKDSQNNCLSPDFYSVEIADLDSDNFMDIIGVKSDGIYIWRGMGGFFRASSRKPVGVEFTQIFRNSLDIEALDINSNNIKDLAIGFLELGNTGILVFEGKITQYCSEGNVMNCCPNGKGCCEENPINPDKKTFLGRGPICIGNAAKYGAGRTNNQDQVMIDVYYETKKGEVFLRGDTNNDGKADMTDAIYLLNYLFLGQNVLSCRDAGDVNDDGKTDLTDAVGLLEYLFLGKASPREPFGSIGMDSTADELDCKCYGNGC